LLNLIEGGRLLYSAADYAHGMGKEVRILDPFGEVQLDSSLRASFNPLGGRFVWVRGHDKVLCHLMFGILALAAEQLMRLVA
jgi:hypothetical protein